MSKPLLGGALVVIVVLFLVVELKHVHLIEALVERGTDLDPLILMARRDGTQAGWYDGPKVSIAAQNGADCAGRIWPDTAGYFLPGKAHAQDIAENPGKN